MTIYIDALKRDKRPQSSTLVHALIDRLEAAEKERDKLKELNIALCTKSNSQVIHNARLAEENDTLHAKIEAMERQEPSEQDASVRKAWARFSHELHRSPDAPYPGMADAFEQHFSQSFIDREWKAEAATWAAAWKAAKRHCGQPALGAPSVPRESIERMLTQLMDIAVSNGANSISMPDEYVEVAAWLCGIPAQPAPIVPECPYPCGWRNLLKHAIEDGAYLARSINEDEPVTENARAVTMRMVTRLRDVLMAVNNAAPEFKP